MRRLLPLLLLLFLAVGIARTAPVARAADNGVITGHIANGTADGPIPTGLTVTLAGITSTGQAATAFQSRTATVAGDGSFRFDGLPITTDYGYVATVAYQGVTYVAEMTGSDGQPTQLLNLTDSAPTVDSSVKVYETTADDPGVKVTLEHMLFEVDQSGGGQLIVLDVVNLNNPSDRAYTGKPGADGSPAAALKFSLPANASGLQPYTGLDPSRLTSTADGFQSTDPVTPGVNTIAFMYLLPYDESGTVNFQRAVSVPTDRITVLVQQVQNANVTVDSTQFTGWTQTSQNGENFNMGSYGPADVGTTLSLNINGLPPPSATQAAATKDSGGSSRMPLIVGGVGILAALALLGLYLRLRGQLAAPQPLTEGPGTTPEPVAERHFCSNCGGQLVDGRCPSCDGERAGVGATGDSGEDG